MSSKYAKKVDANQADIVRWVRNHGYEVRIVGKPLDLLVTSPAGLMVYLEVKVKGSKAQYTATQLKFIGETKSPVIFATDREEAMTKLRNRDYLTRRQKDNLTAMLILSRGKTKFTPAEVAQALGEV